MQRGRAKARGNRAAQADDVVDREARCELARHFRAEVGVILEAAGEIDVPAIGDIRVDVDIQRLAVTALVERRAKAWEYLCARRGAVRRERSACVGLQL